MGQEVGGGAARCQEVIGEWQHGPVSGRVCGNVSGNNRRRLQHGLGRGRV